VTSQTTLDRIVAATQARVEALGARRDALVAAAAAAAAPQALRWREAFAGDAVSVIAEVKRRSPSAGSIAPSMDPVQHASAYVAGGAAAVSVLTEPTFFGGTIDDLERIREAVPVPVLRKDFILDPVQLYEARVAGASAVLLIVRILGDDQLHGLADRAHELGLATVIEVHDERELDRALQHSPDTVGVNARDLETFHVEPATLQRLLGRIPPDLVALAESGMSSRGDVERAASWGADAVLVGTAVASAADPATSVHDLTGVSRQPRGGGVRT
jgi:indole-3-glycerol phosphate synthase